MMATRATRRMDKTEAGSTEQKATGAPTLKRERIAGRATAIDKTFVAIARSLGIMETMLRREAEHLRQRHTSRANAECTELAQELQDALRLKDELVAVVSHELRTPTHVIMGWSRMLEQHQVNPERVEHAFSTIRRSAESLGKMLDDLTDASQLAAGRLRLSLAPMNLTQVVCEAVEAVRVSAEHKRVVLINGADGAAPMLVQGDASRLKQIVWNVLCNAIKFTPAGGEVAVSTSLTGHRAHIEVRDTGCGIDPDFLPFVFQRFRQAKTNCEQPGIGLGLAIVRHLVNRHGGTISARSGGVGQGATFTIELPVA